MHNSCKTIAFTGALSIITIITTWHIATNILVIHLLGNEEVKQFALTISGGLFTGFFVLMLSEVHKYCNLKRDTERIAFFHTLYLYQALFMMKSNTLGSLAHPKTRIEESFYDESIRMIQSELYAIQSVEYYTFICGDDSLAYAINCFKKEVPQHISIMVQIANSLRAADIN